ncbi:KaiC family protein [Rhodocytophaga rosea]|uniref:non-specific serine/threonine protein kinase n=1 Tax=Rhodocytophaga rosea TaxID=2704465 RepID=A0A6C0GCN2_9BACT|nr:circadian clock protein KaiC [Rhodocytophaga rosea]QHT65440.1 KaiC family protein [Rhodocytophaga rosea]
MKTDKDKSTLSLPQLTLAKTQTGIDGLDEITQGGLPKGRPTLICGSAGCGKTLMAMEFLVNGATLYNEPGVFMAFEETSEELATNVASLGFDLKKLSEEKKLKVDYVYVERSEIEETGEYDLEGLFIRLGYAIDSIGAKRVVLDTIESLFSGLSNPSILRAEIRRLFRFLKEKGLTAIITGERGDATLTRQGLEEFVSDCVILLDHRIINQISTRRLRIVKYRGTTHGTNEYPFLIDEDGISVLPVTSLGLAHEVSDEIISSGVKGLDEMLGKGGFYKGSTVLITGTAGTAKTTFASSFAYDTCKRKERCLFFAFEESEQQLLRNMKQVGLDLEPFIKKGLLQIYSSRPTLYGLEMHLVTIHKLINSFKPDVVVIDPMSNLVSVGGLTEVQGMLTRLIDFLKVNKITALLTALTIPTGNSLELTEEGISSLVDSWVLVRDVEGIGERNRGIFVIKSRGMQHSNQVREFVITDQGIRLLDVNIGPTGILTGSARLAYQMQQTTSAAAKQNEIDKKDRELARKRKILEASIENMRTEFESIEEDLRQIHAQELFQQNLPATDSILTKSGNGSGKKKTKR